MKAQDRVIATLRHEDTDRVPITGLITNDKIASKFGKGNLNEENADKVMLEASISCFDIYFVNHSGIAFGPCFQEGDFRDEFEYEWRQKRWTRWVVKRPWSNIQEMARVLEKETLLMDAWQPESHPEYFRGFPKLISAGEERSCPCHYEIGSAPTSYFRDGLEEVTYLVQDYPEIMKRWVECRHKKNLRHLEYLLKNYEFKFIRVDADIAYRGGLIYSPHFLEEWGWFKRLAELTDLCHSYHAFFVFHSDGNLTPILKQLCAARIDMLTPVDVGAGMEFELVKKEYGKRITLVGGFPHKILADGTVAEVRRYTRWLIDIGRKESGFILSDSSDEFDNSIPLENFEVMLDTVYGN